MGGSSIQGHPRVDILIGHAVPIYQAVLAATIRGLRPHLIVHRAKPEELGPLVCRLQPALVICSSVGEVTVQRGTSWAVLYPDERDEMIVTTHQSSRTVPHANISALLHLLDSELGL
jgi:hypothetical protein